MRGDRRYLAQDENIVLRVHRHISVLLRPFVYTVIAIGLAAAIGVLTSPSEGGDLVDTLAGLIAGVFLIRLAWKVWDWRARRIVITDRRLFEVSGILSRRVASMPLAKMTDVTYNRSLLGRMLGYGELIVETAGQEQSLHRITHLPKPDDFYRTITFLVTGDLIPVAEVKKPFQDLEEEDTGPLPRVIV